MILYGKFEYLFPNFQKFRIIFTEIELFVSSPRIFREIKHLPEPPLPIFSARQEDEGTKRATGLIYRPSTEFKMMYTLIIHIQNLPGQQMTVRA